jgi:hypothetical protein
MLQYGAATLVAALSVRRLAPWLAPAFPRGRAIVSVVSIETPELDEQRQLCADVDGLLPP